VRRRCAQTPDTAQIACRRRMCQRPEDRLLRYATEVASIRRARRSATLMSMTRWRRCYALRIHRLMFDVSWFMIGCAPQALQMSDIR
jgi:hypothetical protein